MNVSRLGFFTWNGFDDARFLAAGSLAIGIGIGLSFMRAEKDEPHLLFLRALGLGSVLTSFYIAADQLAGGPWSGGKSDG